MESTTADSSELKFQQNFEEKLHHYDNNHLGSFRKPWSSDRIIEVIANVKNARVSMVNTDCRTSMSYYWLSKYDIITINNEEHLIFKRKNPEDPIIRIIPREDYFNILNALHKKCGHGGRDKMVCSFKNRYYIPKKAIEIFVSLCPTCNTKKKIPKKTTVTQPTAFQDFNSRGQVDLIDLQSCPDGDYKWLLKYQDNATKFMNLRPLQTDTASEVAMKLLEIFLTFGAPHLLQSGNGVEFTTNVLKKLVEIWPDCKTVQDGPRDPQTHSNVDRSNRDIEKMIRSWMIDKKSTNWSVGCLFCQYQNNSSFLDIIGRSPYKALFGSELKADLSGMNITSQLLLKIETEEQDNNIVNEVFDDGYDVPIADTINEQPETSNKYEMTYTDTKEILDKSNDTAKLNDATNEIDSFPVNLIRVRVGQPSCSGDYPTNVENSITDSPCFQPVSTCVVCHKPTNGAHTSLSEDGEAPKLLCFDCGPEKNRMFQKNNAHKRMKRASEYNIETTCKKLPPLAVGKCVLINIPEADRGLVDTKNIKGKIVDFRNGVYRIGTKSGTIKNWFERQELQPLMESYDGDILGTPISLREAVNNESVYSLEVYQKCICQPAKNQCRTMRCSCFKKNVLCGSKCHSNSSCVNK